MENEEELSNEKANLSLIDRILPKVPYINFNENEDDDETTNEEINKGLWVGSKPEDLNSGICLYFQQLFALFIKRFIHSIRNKSLITSQIILPILILLINLVYVKYGPIVHKNSPPLKMDIASYGHNYLPIHVTKTGLSTTLNTMSKIYEEQFNNVSTVQAFNLLNTSKVNILPNARGSIDEYLIGAGKMGFTQLNDEHLVAADFTMKDSYARPFSQNPSSQNFLNNFFKIGVFS